MFRPVLILAILVCSAARADAAPELIACTAWGGSHTSKYSFLIDRQTCRVHWREIDKTLDILECDPPRLRVRKPFAPADGYELRFDLSTGQFSDHVPGWAEYGRCENPS